MNNANTGPLVCLLPFHSQTTISKYYIVIVYARIELTWQMSSWRDEVPICIHRAHGSYANLSEGRIWIYSTLYGPHRGRKRSPRMAGLKFWCQLLLLRNLIEFKKSIWSPELQCTHVQTMHCSWQVERIRASKSFEWEEFGIFRFQDIFELSDGNETMHEWLSKQSLCRVRDQGESLVIA